MKPQNNYKKIVMTDKKKRNVFSDILQRMGLSCIGNNNLEWIIEEYLCIRQ